MKKLSLTVILFLCGIQMLSASTDPRELFLAARHQSNLFEDDTQFQLDVDFHAQMQIPAQGHLTLKWAGKDRWWRKVVMGSFEQVDIRNGDKLYTTRNASFTPVRVGELFTLLQLSEPIAPQVVKKQKERVENGIQMTCLRVQEARARSTPHEICMNSAHEILSDEWKEYPDDQRSGRYSGYFDFRAHRYPRTLELVVDGSKVITANVNELTAATFEENLLVPAKGAIERRKCAGITPPVPVRTPNPTYPRSNSQNGLMGDSTVAMTVLADGSVSNIQLVGTATHSMDDATMQTLRGWKFKPAMCGADPVVSDIEVVVSFRLR
ncbi:MAG TPA: energy transducer TonB [Candidatus Sulfotelmatobacter sp.]|jgi:TonB family protein